MKNTLLLLSLSYALTSYSHAATTITSTGANNGGAIMGSTITYSIAGGMGLGQASDGGGNGISFTTANGITINFTGAVDITISPTITDASNVFDTPGNFTTVGGELNYTVGTVDVEGNTNPNGGLDQSIATFSGNGTNTFSWTITGDDSSVLDSHRTNSNEDWGTITANGITSLSFTNTAFVDTYQITVEPTAVPEPSSALLASLAAFGCCLRRKRR